jgi:hypothetical protein
MIDFRTMNLNDIDAGLSLCRAENWNQLARDWEIFLHLSPDGSWGPLRPLDIKAGSVGLEWYLLILKVDGRE